MDRCKFGCIVKPTSIEDRCRYGSFGGQKTLGVILCDAQDHSDGVNGAGGLAGEIRLDGGRRRPRYTLNGRQRFQSGGAAGGTLRANALEISAVFAGVARCERWLASRLH